MLSKEASSTIFWISGIELRPPGPLANTLTARPMSGVQVNDYYPTESFTLNYITVYKLLVFDWNVWNHQAVNKFFVLDRKNEQHITVCKKLLRIICTKMGIKTYKILTSRYKITLNGYTDKINQAKTFTSYKQRLQISEWWWRWFKWLHKWLSVILNYYFSKLMNCHRFCSHIFHDGPSWYMNKYSYLSEYLLMSIEIVDRGLLTIVELPRLSMF